MTEPMKQPDPSAAEGPPPRNLRPTEGVAQVDQDELQPPEPVVHAFTKQEVAEHSPEGLPPDERVFKASTGLLTVVAAIAIACLLIGSIWLGWVGFVAAGVMLGVYFLSAWPAWSAGLMRHRERAEAARKVREELVKERLEQQAERESGTKRHAGRAVAAGGR